jgi:hypothetical protein
MGTFTELISYACPWVDSISKAWIHASATTNLLASPTSLSPSKCMTDVLRMFLAKAVVHHQVEGGDKIVTLAYLNCSSFSSCSLKKCIKVIGSVGPIS